MPALFRFLSLALILTAAAFLVHTGAKNPGTFHFTGFGWDVQMSATLFIMLLGILVICTYFVGQAITYISNIPQRFKNKRGLKKAQGGLDLIHQGFMALHAGDNKTAQKLAEKATKKLPSPHLADYLTAQAETQNEDMLIALTNNPQTALAGHLGLMENAQADNQWGQVRHHAEKALSLHKNAPKAKQALLESALRQQNWVQAQQYTQDADILASLALLEALDERDTDPEEANKVTSSALKKNSTFVPLVMFQAGLLSSQAKHKQAEKLLTNAFLSTPRLDTFSRLLDTLAITTQDRVKRFKRAETIIKKLPQTEAKLAHLATAEAALDTRDLQTARKSLSSAMNFGENRTLCQLFAKIEKQEGNSTGSAEWLQKALTAPTLVQSGDLSVTFWQTFKNTYTETTTPTQLQQPQNMLIG